MAGRFMGLGKTTVPVPGTPVQIAIPAAVDPKSCHACIIEVLPNNTGKVFVGVSGLDKATLANVLVILPIPTVNLIPAFSISIAGAANGISLKDLWIDTDIANEGTLASIVIA